jgi:hypothetical protein
VRVSFEPSAAALPQEEIRAAVGRELERRPNNEPIVAGELSVAIEGEHLILRFRSREGYTERLLPLPEDRTQIPLLLALLASNLARDQRVDVRAAEPPAPRAQPDAPRPAPEPARPAYKRHHFGIHVAQDVTFVGGTNVCDPYTNVAPYSCFYEGTDEPFFHRPAPDTDSIE